MSKFHKDMAKLVGICYDQLPKNNLIREYLNVRKISKNTIDNFFIGSFPTNLRVLLREFKPDFLIQTGLFYRADRSPFRSYPLIIPICDVNNNFIGIGGRNMMPESQMKALGMPKYKNSIYNKAAHLFGLNKARQFIRDKNQVIIVEGYFDVISSHQSGLCNVVATSGTYLSPKQVMLMSRYTNNINMLFDNDPAGKRAAKKSIENHSIDGLNIKEIFLPDGYKDIDECIVNNSDFDINNL